MIYLYRIMIAGWVLFCAGCLHVHQGLMLNQAGHIQHSSKCYMDHQEDQKPAIQEKLPQNFKIFVWNMYKGKAKGWLEVLKKHAQGADFVLLQEAIDHQHLTHWLNINHPNWTQVQAFQYRRINAGVLTGSYLASAFECGFKFPEPFIRIPKSALVNIYPLADHPQKLLMINIHAVNFEPGNAAYRKQLQSLGDLIHTHQGPVIFAGDFNSWSPKRIQLLRKLIQSYQMQEATLDQEQRTKIFGLPIDHIFYRGLTMTDFKVITTKASDHHPLIAHFQVASTGD